MQGILLLASASHENLGEGAHLKKSDYHGANALRDWTALMNPHAKLQRQKLVEQAEERKRRRKLLQVISEAFG